MPRVAAPRPASPFKRPHATRRRMTPVEAGVLAVVAMYQADNHDDISIAEIQDELRPNVSIGAVSDLHHFGALKTPVDHSGELIGTKCRLTREGLDELNEGLERAIEEAKRLKDSSVLSDNPQNMPRLIELLETYQKRRKGRGGSVQADDVDLDDPDPHAGAGLEVDSGDQDLTDELEDLDLDDPEPEKKPAKPTRRATSRRAKGG